MRIDKYVSTPTDLGEYEMKNNVTLTITSLLSILLATFHLSDDIVRGFEPGGFRHVSGILMMVVWMFGALVLSGRRSGYIIMLLGSILGSVMPLAHMRGVGLVGGRIVNSGGKFFWVWTLIALGVVAFFSFVLSVLGLWSLRRKSVSLAQQPED
jgi:hypothetical protein